MVDDAVGIDTDVNGEAIRACEVAQAALFAAALKTEITGLRVRVEAAEQRCTDYQTKSQQDLGRCR